MLNANCYHTWKTNFESVILVNCLSNQSISTFTKSNLLERLTTSRELLDHLPFRKSPLQTIHFQRGYFICLIGSTEVDSHADRIPPSGLQKKDSNNCICFLLLELTVRTTRKTKHVFCEKSQMTSSEQIMDGE